MTDFTRKFLEEFAKDNKNTDLTIFGSTAAGSPLTSSDPEVLQSNSKFGEGWAGATLLNAGNLTRNPVQNEWSALNYIHNYQINHILQKGLQEYNTLTEYFIGDMVREIEGLKLYQSLTNNNTGNDLSDDTKWQLSSGLEATNVIIINSINDFPTAVAGVITLEDGKRYVLNATIVTSNRFVLPTGSIIEIVSVNLLKYILSYTGSDTFFSGDGIVSVSLIDILVSGTSTAKFMDIENGGAVFWDRLISSTWGHAGEYSCTLVGNNFEIDNVTTTGLVFNKRTSVTNANIIMTTGFVGNVTTNPSTIMLDFDNDLISKIEISGGGAITAGNETIFNFDSVSLPAATTISIKGFNIFTAFNLLYAATSSKQDRINSNFEGSIGITSSQTIGSLAWVGNATDTVITTQTTYVNLLGTTFEVTNERCSQTANNELTFTNSQSLSKTLIARLDVLRGAGSGTPTFQFRILKNGSPIQVNSTDITSMLVTNSSDSVNMVLTIPIDVITGDVFIIQGQNITNTSNILITDGTLIIN